MKCNKHEKKQENWRYLFHGRYNDFFSTSKLLIERCFYVFIRLWEGREIFFIQMIVKEDFESFLCAGLHLRYTHFNHASVLVWNRNCYTWLSVLIILGKDNDVFMIISKFALLLYIKVYPEIHNKNFHKCVRF